MNQQEDQKLPEDTFTYQLLGRLQQDCDYYLGMGNRNKKHLWAQDEKAQIEKMHELYEQLSEKPKWLTLQQIEQYAAKMLSEPLVTTGEMVAGARAACGLSTEGELMESTAYKIPTLSPSGRFIIDQDHRKIAEVFQPGDSPAEQEAIKRRIVGSFNALPDIIGVLLRANKEGALSRALDGEGIADAYDSALSEAVKAIGDEGIADVAYRYELDPEVIRSKIDGCENVTQHADSSLPGK